MVDQHQVAQSEATTNDEQPLPEDNEAELTEEDLGIVDGADGGQPTYPPYL